MIFKLHYWFFAAGANAVGLLLGVFMEAYTDANSVEIGMLYMMMPFIGIIFRPIICSYADRKQAHKRCLMICLVILSASYFPFILIPLCGPGLYEQHPRLCFYVLLTLKVLGDISFGGIISIGDSLAINYSKRLGVPFSVYRVWGTISWMVFGAITGQINEVWFLPKYVPAFIVLILSSLLNLFSIYLWPDEYFRMVPHADAEPDDKPDAIKEKEGKDKRDKKKENVMTKSLMPREVVWAHAKHKLWLLCTFRCGSKSEAPILSQFRENEIANAKNQGNILNDTKVNQRIVDTTIDKKTQVKILLHLIRRDPRIILYLLLFVCAGFCMIALSFFYISLSQICHENDRCNFSQLAGFLQVSMAAAETIIFIYIKQMLDKFGRLNTISIAFFIVAAKFTFYGTVWLQVDPYFSLLVELAHGVVFGIFVTLMVEMGHLFANEVEFVIPELIDKRVVSEDADTETLKLSLLATMQAIISNANDGLGRGIGALIYGLIVDHYSYTVLWRCIAGGSAVVFIVIQVSNILDRVLGLDLGASLRKNKQIYTDAAPVRGDGEHPRSPCSRQDLQKPCEISQA